MAWIAAIAAASACNDGRRRKKPSKLVVLVTVFSLVLGIFVPLVIILGMYSSSTMALYPLIFVFIIMIGLVVLVAAGVYDDETGTADRGNYRSSGKQRSASYRDPELEENYYWGSASKSTAYFCTTCGSRLESDDRFCASCGRRVT